MCIAVGQTNTMINLRSPYQYILIPLIRQPYVLMALIAYITGGGLCYKSDITLQSSLCLAIGSIPPSLTELETVMFISYDI